MSTDSGRSPAGSDPSRLERAQLRRFRRFSAATVAVLALLAAGLGVAAVVRGPHLDSAALNLGQVIERSGQALVLQADQPVEAVAAEQVSVEPAADVAVSTEGSQVTVTFAGPLDYATDYRVRVDGVTGASTGLAGSLEYGFRTPDPGVYTLLRQGGADAAIDRPDDQILRSTVGGGAAAASEVVFEAPRIQQFAVTDQALAAVLVGDDGGTSLVVSVRDNPAATVPTPTGSRVQNLHASPSARLFGFTVNGGTDVEGRMLQNALFVYDPLGASGRAEEVTGFEGAPLRVVSWSFVPGSSSIVAQSTDEQLYLLDPIGGAAPVPLGRHGELRGFLAGGVQLVVADPSGTSTIDLATGAVAPLVQEAPEVDPALYPGTIATLASGATIRQYDEVDYSLPSPVLGSVILYADETGTRELYRPATAGARVRSFCVSPNGQYLAVETIPSGALSDGYALPGYSGMTTTLVSIATGESARGVAGFLPDWCS